MGRLSVENIKPGMVLGQDVKDKNARVLLRKGVALQEKHFRIFKMWGISALEILHSAQDGMDSNESPPVDPEDLRMAEIVADEIFRHTDMTNSVVQLLYRLRVNLIAEQETLRKMDGKAKS